jgi:hypothetical protein
MGHGLFGGGPVHEYYAGTAVLSNPSIDLDKKMLFSLRIIHCDTIDSR